MNFEIARELFIRQVKVISQHEDALDAAVVQQVALKVKVGRLKREVRTSSDALANLDIAVQAKKLRIAQLRHDYRTEIAAWKMINNCEACTDQLRRASGVGSPSMII